MFNYRYLLTWCLLPMFFLSACGTPPTGETGSGSALVFNEKIDDWQFKPADEEADMVGGSAGMVTRSKMTTAMPMAAEASIGLAVGGAKDANNFRENIKNHYLPIPTDISYEGLYYDYYFETGQTEECPKLFCPSYATAVSPDPFSKTPEYYLSVGLNSGIKESDFVRKKLNLVVVLDMSGSMESPFDTYYYDQFGNKVELEKNAISTNTKIEIATRSIVNLLAHLRPEDRLGIVLFDDQGYLAKPLDYYGRTDAEKLKKHLLGITSRGGTYMEAGVKIATEQYQKYLTADKNEYENRMIFMTDAMPNIGETNDDNLLAMTKKNAEQGVYTTFVGIGVDFNTALINHITQIRGANYYAVHSEKSFTDVLDNGFDYMVTPLVFNLQLKVQAEGYQIEKVFGSPEADEATGEIMKVNTLFPSRTEGGATKGGLVLLKLKPTASHQPEIKLSVSYEDRQGRTDGEEKVITLTTDGGEYFDNLGIRKGVVLARYVSLIKDWLINAQATSQEPVLVTREQGIVIPPETGLNQWERQSQPLVVNDHYRDLFKDFSSYLETEIKALGDTTLRQEIDILNLLLAAGLSTTDYECVRDSDCACGTHRITGECFVGNKQFVDPLHVCPDYCRGIAGQFQIKFKRTFTKEV